MPDTSLLYQNEEPTVHDIASIAMKDCMFALTEHFNTDFHYDPEVCNEIATQLRRYTIWLESLHTE